jgi:hypothetical protein
MEIMPGYHRRIIQPISKQRSRFSQLRRTAKSLKVRGKRATERRKTIEESGLRRAGTIEEQVAAAQRYISRTAKRKMSIRDIRNERDHLDLTIKRMIEVARSDPRVLPFLRQQLITVSDRTQLLRNLETYLEERKRLPRLPITY